MLAVKELRENDRYGSRVCSERTTYAKDNVEERKQMNFIDNRLWRSGLLRFSLDVQPRIVNKSKLDVFIHRGYGGSMVKQVLRRYLLLQWLLSQVVSALWNL
jgi:hypothetical protein